MSRNSWKRIYQWALGTRCSNESERGPKSHFARLQVMRLEDRRVLSGTPWLVLDDASDPGSDTYVIDAGDDANDGQADEFHVDFEQGVDSTELHVRVRVNGETVFESGWSPNTHLLIAGSSDADRLVVDFSQLEILVGGRLTFQAGENSAGEIDTLELTGGNGHHVTHAFDAEGAGRVDFLDVQLVYQQTESVSDGLNVASRQIVEAGGVHWLGVAEAERDGWSRITAETGFQLEFASPTDELLISSVNNDLSADGTLAGDHLSVGGLDAQFGGIVKLEGDATDTIVFEGHWQSELRELNVAAGTIEVAGDLTLHEADVRFDAFRELVVGEVAELRNLGGSVALSAPSLELHGLVDASSGGSVLLDAGQDGQLDVDGSILSLGNAFETHGGEVTLLGQRIVLHEGAVLDVSGQAGGGTLLIGGDFQGANPDLHNALSVEVGSGVLLRADAVDHGNGGKVIVWSDGTTRYAGGISARGGAAGGDGGFIEISGKQHLAFAGGVDAGAVQGRQGQLLLDPETIVISDLNGIDNAEAADGQVLFDDPGGLPAGITFFIQPSAFEAINADVTLQATADIFVLDDIDLSAANATTFTLQAGNDIHIQANITGTNAVRNLVFEADSNGSDGVGQVILDANVTISSNGGDITFRGAGVSFDPTAAIAAGSGDVVLQPTTAVAIDVGTANAGTFVVTNADIDLISTTGTIIIGDRNLVSAMEVQGVTAGAKNLRFETGGDINDVMANTAVTLTTGHLELVAEGIGTTSTFDIAVSRLSLSPGVSFDVTSTTALAELSVSTDGTVASQTLSDGGTTTYSVTEAAGDTTIDAVTGAGLDFTYVNTAGSIQVGTAPGVAIDTSGGSVTLSAVNAIAINAGIVTGGGNAALQAGGDVLFSADGSIDVQAGAGTVTVVADTDVGGDGAITMADGSFLNAADGALNLSAAQDVAVSLLTTTGSIAIESQSGSIADADGGSGLDFQATMLRIQAASGAGTLADPLESQVGAVEGTFGTGGFALDNDGSLTIGGVDAGTTGISAGGPVQITLTGIDNLLQVDETVDSGGAALTLTADQLQLAASISSAAGLITLRTHDSAQAIQVGAGATDDATALGLTDAELDFVSTTGGLTIGDSLQTAGIAVVGAADQATVPTITGGTFTLETSGDIVVDAPLVNAVDTVLRTTDGNIAFTGAGSVTADGLMVTLDAQNGAIVGNAVAQVDVVSQTLVMTANQGIGSGQSLETAVGELSALNEGVGAAGDIDIVNQGTLNLSQSAITRNTAPGGDIRVAVVGAGNDLFVAGTVESAGDVVLQATDQIQFAQAAGVSGIIAGGQAQLTAEQIAGNAAAAVDISAGAVNLSTQTSIAAMGVPLELSTAALSATAVSGDVVIDNAATMDVTVTNLATGTGHVSYRQSGNHGLTLSTVSTGNGDVTISNTGGSAASILIGSVSADLVDDAITVSAEGSINDAQADLIADLTAFRAELNAAEGIGDNARLETNLTELSGLNTTSGDVRVTNDGSLNLGGTTGLQNQAAGGAIDLEVAGPGSDLVVTGTVSADGNVMLTAPDEIRFAQAAATLGVESVSGTAILDANRIVGNPLGGIDVGGNALSARSVAGVGSLAVPLETAVSQLEADGGTGGVFILNDGNVILFGMGVSADGEVRLAADGSLTVPVAVTSNLDDVVLASNGLLTTLAAGVISAAGDVTLTAGDIALNQSVLPGSSRAFIRGTGAVFLGSQSGAGLQLSSAEAGLIDAEMLVIGTNAGGPITAEGFVPLKATTLILRSGQSIFSGSLAGAPDVVVENLAIDAAQGVTLETNVDQLAVLNRFGGDIRIRELVGDMTSGSVLTESGTLVGITNTGSGDIDLTTVGTLIVMQNLTTFGGRIDGDTGSGVQFAPGASARIIESGIITAAVDGVPPNLQNLVAPQITTLGEASVSGQFGGNIGLLARNYTITVDWMDGTVETFTFAQPQTPGGPVSFTFSHFYLQNPTGNSASPIPIMVTVADDPRIEFSINGSPIEDPGTLLFAEVPGTGVFGVRIDTTPDVRPLVFPPMTPVSPLEDAVPPTLDTTQAVPVRSASLEKVAVDERVILLRVLSPTGETVREIPLEESVLDDLPGMFSRLPDGHYRIYLKEPGEFRERLVLDVDVRQGKAVDQAPSAMDPNRDPGQLPIPTDAEPGPPREELPPDGEPGPDEPLQEKSPAANADEGVAPVLPPPREDRQSGTSSTAAAAGRHR